MTAETFASPLAALTAGLVASAHCVGMCGPLICATAGPGKQLQPALFYHTGRFFVYSLLGGLCGWLGSSVAPWFNSVPVRLLPAAFLVFFLVVALGWDRRLPVPAWLGKLGAGFMRQTAFVPRPLLPLLLGLGTPFLPCAPLYLALSLCLFSGSFLAGSALMTAYLLGTVPALLFLQANWSWLGRRLSPDHLNNIQRTLALVAAGLVLWRSLGGMSLLSPGACPLCR